MDSDRPMDVKQKLDENKLRTIISNLQKRIIENQKLRVKYPDDPRKFAASETELFAALDELQIVTDRPDLYNVLIEKNVEKLLLPLVSHENPDISAKTIIVIQELIDVDDEDSNDHTNRFIDLLHQDGMCEKIVFNNKRFDIKNREEAEAINNSISVISSMIDRGYSHGGSSFSSEFINQAIKQLNSVKFNNIKLSMIELLNTILFDGENSSHFYESKGIAALLKQIAYYRRYTPTTPSEKEYLYQVLHCLCNSLLDQDDYDHTRESFYEEEGVELVELILRERREGIQETAIKYHMLKAFNNCISSSKPEPIVTKCCERFIEVLGLRVLFPIFFNPKVIIPKNVKEREVKKIKIEIQENTISIINELMKHCQNPELLQRILLKFAEKNFEKFDRLIKLQSKYYIEYKQYSDKCDEIEEKKEKFDELLADKCDHADSVLSDLNYIFLLICYLSDKYETYDPMSGEKFSNRIKKLLEHDKPELRDQILEKTRVIDSETKSNKANQEANSLSLLLNHLKKITSIGAIDQ